MSKGHTPRQHVASWGSWMSEEERLLTQQKERNLLLDRTLAMMQDFDSNDPEVVRPALIATCKALSAFRTEMTAIEWSRGYMGV